MTRDNQPRPAAILWDYDGTMLDTEPIWMSVEKRMVADAGGSWSDEQAKAAIGISADETSRRLIAAIGDSTISIADMNQRRFELVSQAVSAMPLPWRPGAEALLNTAHNVGLPMAVVSTSPASVIAAGLKRMPLDWFQVVISGDDVEHHKPAPDSYLLAAQNLGVTIADCLVIEDSPSGCQAALAAGAGLLAVPSQTELKPLPGMILRHSLESLTM
ncbi:MAG: HAD family phosphatase, partial [Propionibacteriaceae bacterium]|nr:HAD family phosphatase [Propionibacteriaceae bacterium]